MKKENEKIKIDYRLIRYIIWPVIVLIILVILGYEVSKIDITIGYLIYLITLINTLVFIIAYIINKKKLSKELLKISEEISRVNIEHLENFDIAHAVLDSSGRIIWYNNTFFDVVLEAKLDDKNIHSIFNQISSENFPDYAEKFEKNIEYEEKVYKAVIIKNSIDRFDSKLVSELNELLYYTLYLYDITKEEQLAKINNDQMAIVGYIYIDNYEEVYSTLREDIRPVLTARIDRAITLFAQSVEGIVRKIEKDRYILFFQNKFLKEIEENKFNILDEIREIDVTNIYPVTISIGIGVSQKGYINSLNYANTAIELALGRGGDQAVIKNNDKYAFYGGKSRGVEKNTRVKARMKAYAFKELINESEKILIMGHTKGDLDCLGAAVGVYSCARLLDKKAYIVLNEPNTSIQSLYDRVVEDEDMPEDLFISGTKAIDMMDENAVLVIVDVNRQSYLEHPKLLDYANKVVVFDHHRVSTEYIENTVLNYVEPYASSTCEMITEILRYISDKITLSNVEADALFAGITLDTKNFVVKTGVKTFEAAAFLRRNGADLIQVRKFFKNDLETYRAKADAISKASIYRDLVAIAVSPTETENPTLVAAQAADELLSISKVKASFVLTELEGVIFISARSFGAINVQLVMEKLGGGGHLSVAGAQIADTSMEDAIRILKIAIDEYIEEGESE